MRAAGTWTAGLALSVLVHAAAALLLVPLYAPREPPAQPPPETRLDMETVAAPQQDAAARDPEAETAAEGTAQGTPVDAGVVPQSDARPAAAQAERQAPVPPRAPRVAEEAPIAAPLAQVLPEPGRIAAATVGAEALRPAIPETTAAAQAATPPAEPLGPTPAEASTVGAAPVDAAQTQPAAPEPDALAAAEAGGETVRAAAPDPAQTMAAAALAAEPLSTARPAPKELAAAAPRADVAASERLPSASLAAARPQTTSGTSTLPRVPRAAAVSPEGATAPARRPAATASAALTPAPASAAAVTATTAALPATRATGRQTAAFAAEGTPLPQARPKAEPAEEASPPATAATATLAWQFGDRVVTDPQALATIQAFMEPAALDDAEGVKDDLSSVLTGVDCARLSATFIPETGTLEMRGHIPDPELQGPILAALRAQVGEGIPVEANLLHLPAPQCGALAGIADVGLPQSIDQFTNARLIGETAHARQYTYTEGQRLQFDLTAPDYDAFVYVDYFNAEGEVIHLVPNDTIPLEEHAARSVFGVGKDRPGTPGLRITIGPPFGQEIAVAFASSHRLYDGVRPIVEPAAPYLEELQTLVAEARAEHEDFKGEWVYFFITTSPATQ